jgi:subtilisin family serine protease
LTWIIGCQIWTTGYDFVNGDTDPDDDNGHGTHVAGIVGSNDPAAPGIAPNAALMPVKVLGADGLGLSSDVIAGIEWAVNHGADEINLSLGTSGPGDGTSALSQSVDNAVKSGVVVVIAAGNDGPAFETVSSPADARLDLTVGALDTTTTVANFSSRGPTLDGRVEPDVLAPGVNINSAWPGGGFEMKSGTSMAAPHVAGVVALLLDAYPVTPALVKEALTTTAISLSGYDSNTQGHGRVDGDAASDYIQEKLSEASTLILPGGMLVYNYTVTNLGNVDDSFALTVDTEELPAGTLTYPPAIPVAWIQQSPSPIMLASGKQTPYIVRIAVPANWASLEPATYRFTVCVRQAEPEVGDRN